MMSELNRNFELNVTRIRMYQWLLENKNDFVKEKVSNLELFVSLLGGIEQFIIENADYASNSQLNQLISRNLNENRKTLELMIDTEVMRKQSRDKLKRDYKALIESTETNNKKLFTKLSKFITSLSDRLFKQIEYIEYMKTAINKDNSGHLHKVFLSYAFKDLLYLLGIFDYFYKNGIYLYIDAFHNVEQTDGEVLKNLLKVELETSKQFLFLRTANSELAMRGSYQIRQWCAWEIGYYDKLRKNRSGSNITEYLNECFYFRVYEKKIDTNRAVNLLIQSFKQLKSIENGYLE